MISIILFIILYYVIGILITAIFTYYEPIMRNDTTIESMVAFLWPLMLLVAGVWFIGEVFVCYPVCRIRKLLSFLESKYRKS